eukprot:5947067-Prorocentrum_lima.AAC.1
MEDTYFGASHVQAQWKYLGVWTGCCAQAHQRSPHWDLPNLTEITNRTWAMATHTIRERCERTLAVRPSPAIVAQEWNTYM